MIKSSSKAIKAVARNADVNDEALMTIFTGAESLLNSRPLTYQALNPEDETLLTPNHFLHGHFAPSTVDETQLNLKKRWRRVQELVPNFSQGWLKEWLPCIGKRTKWFQEMKDIAVGDIVVVVSPETQQK